MKAIPYPLLLCAFVVAAACGQEPAPPKPAEPAPVAQDPGAVLREVRAQLEKEGIELDAKAQTVSVKAFVNEPRDPIEYLLVQRRGKRHEAVFWTEAKPSVLNAALLMLGLEPGKNATFTEKDPPPSLEEIEKGADPLIVTAPQGMNLWMTVSWTTEDGKQVEHCVEDLIIDLKTQEPVADAAWVYLGGRMAQLYKGDPEVFVADFEGNLVSVCYLAPDNHLATMSHGRARDDQNWWTTKLLPEFGKEVRFVFHRVEPPVHQEREKRLRAARQGADKEKAGGTSDKR